MYKSTLTSNQGPYQHKTYHGITETKFKQRYANYVKSFRNETYQSDTELLNELWSTKLHSKCRMGNT